MQNQPIPIDDTAAHNAREFSAATLAAPIPNSPYAPQELQSMAGQYHQRVLSANTQEFPVEVQPTDTTNKVLVQYSPFQVQPSEQKQPADTVNKQAPAQEATIEVRHAEEEQSAAIPNEQVSGPTTTVEVQPTGQEQQAEHEQSAVIPNEQVSGQNATLEVQLTEQEASAQVQDGE